MTLLKVYRFELALIVLALALATLAVFWPLVADTYVAYRVRTLLDALQTMVGLSWAVPR